MSSFTTSSPSAILNVYSITPPSTSRISSFLSSSLTTLGLGTFHTSLDVRGYCYTFAANAGVCKDSSATEKEHERSVPEGCVAVGRIDLGAVSLSPPEINKVLNKIRATFTESSYHLLYRNCNHFTETFATALVDHSLLPSPSYTRLKSYPLHVNRLAKGTATVAPTGESYVNKYCRVKEEAYAAAGAGERVGWEMEEEGRRRKGEGEGKGKRELTEKQKKAVEGLKKK